MSGDEIVDLVGALAWPIVALGVLVLLREPLVKAVTELGRRTTKLDLQVVSFEFAPRIAPDWRVDMAGQTTDVRHLTSDAVFDSYSYTLFDQLTKADSAGVLVIDLGEGREWLTTRLYLFCALLERARRVRCVVLLQSADGRHRQVLGAASPSAIRDTLTADEPWLQSTFASAWHEAVGVQHAPAVQLGAATAENVTIRKASMGPVSTQEVARTFIRLNQRTTPPLGDDKDWQAFTEVRPGAAQPSTTWEHTRWIVPSALPKTLSSVVDTRSLVRIDPSGSPSTEKRSIMLQEGEFVLLVERDGTLRGVVQRTTVLDSAIRAALRTE